MDGNIDVITDTVDGQGPSWFNNTDGQGGFSEAILIGDNSSSNSTVIGDVDNDGDIDIVRYLWGDNAEWYENLFEKPSIKATVYYDNNGNGIRDADDWLFSNQNLLLSPAGLSAWSDAQDIFRFILQPGVSELSVLPDPLYTSSTPSSVEIDSDNLTNECIEFGLEPNGEIIQYTQEFTFVSTRCDVQTSTVISLRNDGNQAIDIVSTLALDEKIEIISSDLTPTDLDFSTATWEINNLLPGRNIDIEVIVQIPPVSMPNEILNSSLSSTIQDRDGNEILTTTTEDNSVLRCAFDPNDKSVSPDFEGDVNYTLFSDTLIYTVRFQNTGNDTAFNVTILDELDTGLDWSTFEPRSSSHDFETTLDDNGHVSFHFPNINLPDSIVNEPRSHGFIKYRINSSPLRIDSIIHNTADIIFDTNPAIRTNTTENILIVSFDQDGDGFIFLDDCDDTNADINPNADEIANNGIDENCDGTDLSTSTHDLSSAIVLISPNPATEYINIKVDGNLDYKVQLYTLNGMLIQAGYNQQQLRLNHLSNGIYILEVQDNNTGQSIIERIVIGR